MSKKRAAVTGGHAYKKGDTFSVRRKRLPQYQDPALLGQEIFVAAATKQELMEHQARELAIITQQRDAALRTLTEQANLLLLVSNVDKAAVQLESLLKRFKGIINMLSAFAQADV